MGITHDLCVAADTFAFDGLPSDVVAAARGAVMDGVANMLAGSQEPLMGPLVRGAVATRSAGSTTLVGQALRTDPVTAALVNATACHAMDFELMWYPGTHPTSPTLAPILAISQMQLVTGEDAIAALVAGFEIQGQLMLAIHDSGIEWPNGVHAPGIVGPFGSAIASAKLLGLDVEQTQMALGIVGSRVGGLMANIGTMTKSTHCGHASRMGLESALLAREGFTASAEVFEGKFGLNEAFFRNALDLGPVVERYGSTFRMVDPGLIVKKYPAQYPTHWSIDAALELKAAHGFAAEDVLEVDVEVGADNVAAKHWPPTTGLGGKFSVAYTVAAALIDGKVGIDTFRDSRFHADDMRAMLPRVNLVLNPDIEAMDFGAAWSRVTVRLRDRTELTARVDRPLGIWDNPISWERWSEKFRDCADRRLSAEETAMILHLLEKLETVDDLASELVALLSVDE